MCTDFSIKANNGDIIIGRSMELGIELNSELFFRSPHYEYDQCLSENELSALKAQEGLKLKSLNEIPAPENMHTWQGKYGFMAMNAFHSDIVAANGMNTEGLTTGTMVLALSQYQAVPKFDGKPDGKNAIYYPFLSTWILSNCQDCQDVIDGLTVDELTLAPGSTLTLASQNAAKDKLIVIDPFDEINPAFKFHFPVQDAKGNSIVLEFVDGKLHISDMKPIGVLTNDPVIAWQQENVLKNYAFINPVNLGLQGNNFSNQLIGQGSGFNGLPGSSTPIDRFVRASMMTNYAYPVANGIEATNLAFHILNTVDIPKGTSRESLEPETGKSEPISDYPQWITACDLTNRIFNIRMYQSPSVYSIDLNELAKNEGLYALDKTHYPLPVDKKVIPITDLVKASIQ
ncbi:MAG: linear amide C-N hydrolase [Marinomonas sp.]